jgi:putative tryptophan/tyrosine transport system substrate-binding protein
MRRREFMSVLGGACGASVLWPRAIAAQQSERIRRIGVLSPSAVDDPDTKTRLQAFQQELERRGWSQERKVHVDYRFAAGNSDQFAPLAQELIALQPDVILAQGTLVAVALQRETRVIPIVFDNVSDPIGSGFVASLARPGGNLTGVLLYEAGIMGKWLAMLREIAPHLTRVAVVGNPKTVPLGYFLRAAADAALALGIEVVSTPIENNDAEIARAMEAFAKLPDGGLLVVPDPTPTAHRDLIITLAARYRLPAVYPFRLFVAAGGLMSYGTDSNDVFRLAASYVDRILRGAKPADLPVQAPTKYETVVNNKTAKAIGLDLPPSLLVRADEVIE